MLLPSYNPYLQVTQVHLCTDFALSSRAGSPTAPQTGSLRQPIWAALDVGKAAGDVLGEVAKDTANPDGCAVCICKCRHRCSARGARRCQLSLAGSTRANPSSTQKIPLVNLEIDESTALQLLVRGGFPSFPKRRNFGRTENTRRTNSCRAVDSDHT